jgi:hypothetical protein
MGEILMKKEDKLTTLEGAVRDVSLCRCHFYHDGDGDFYYYYPIALSETLFLSQNEDDFLLDGYTIRKIAHLRKVEIKDDLCNEINKRNGLTDQIKMPKVDLTSWQTVFESLKAMNTAVIVEDERSDEFAIGIIETVLKTKVYVREFDADGVWNDGITVIPYTGITKVKWGTRYALGWERYLRSVDSF